MPQIQPLALAGLLSFALVSSAIAWPTFIHSVGGERSSTADESHTPTILVPRDSAAAQFKQQFINPKGVMALLLLVGADTVQKAIAQMTGGRHEIFTPVVFSFGWVAYAVMSATNALGDGRFLPKPDYPGTVVVVGTTGNDDDMKPRPELGLGDRRENQSWVLGRLMRDLELKVARSNPKPCLESGLIVTFWKLDPGKHSSLKHKKDFLWYSFIGAIPLQLGITAIPWILHNDWDIFFITAVGNLLALLTAALPSMRKEGADIDHHTRHTFALTGGNGHKHVFIIQPDSFVQNKSGDNTTNASKLPRLDHMATSSRPASKWTRIFSVILAAFWMLLLIAVSGIEQNTWYLVGAGMIGMILNSMLSSWPREPDAHGLPLKPYARKLPGGVEPNDDEPTNFGIGFKKPSGKRPKVRKVLLKLERSFPGFGHALRPLFFNGLESDVDREWENNLVSWETAKERLSMYPADRIRYIVEQASSHGPPPNQTRQAARDQNRNPDQETDGYEMDDFQAPIRATAT